MTDQRLYDEMVAYAARHEHDALADTMRGYGRPPYDDVWGYAFVMGYYDKLEPYPEWEHFRNTGPGVFAYTGHRQVGAPRTRSPRVPRGTIRTRVGGPTVKELRGRVA